MLPRVVQQAAQPGHSCTVAPPPWPELICASQAGQSIRPPVVHEALARAVDASASPLATAD
jgi:hypothetical protein